MLISEIANAVVPNAEHKIIGIRPGEKIHEEMITSSDSYSTVDLGSYFAVLPSADQHLINDYVKNHSAKLVKPDFSYNSRDNPTFLSVDQLRELIRNHVSAQAVSI